MTKKRIANSIPIVTLITYGIMILMNALANIIPINGQETGEISDAYENLFAPAGLTFAIWGVIYLLLLGFTVYQLTYYKSKNEANKKLFIKIGVLFSISSLANAIWIVMWHYENFFISLVLMIVILISLIMINLMLRNKQFKPLDKVLIRLPFTVYLGWITVATIANVTTYLVSIGWDSEPLSEVLWTIIIIIVGALIGSISMIFYKSTSYGAVILWAYLGITIKHISVDGFDGEYIAIMIAIFASMVLLIIAEVLVVKKKIRVRQSLKSDETVSKL